MRVVPPLEINAARLTACNVPEPSPGEQIYNAGTTYAAGDRAISTATHRTYESLIGGNLGNALTDVTKWADVGPTNRYAMFDHYRSTKTVRAGEVSMTIRPGVRIDTLALIGVQAVTCHIRIMAGSPATEVYNRTIPLASRQVSSWSQYFFTSFDQKEEVFQFDIPQYSDNELSITLTDGGEVKIGTLILGQSVLLGQTAMPVSDDAINFSKIERDQFGNVTLIPRRSVPTTDVKVRAEKGAVPRLRKLREQVNAVPALWIGIDDASDEYFDSVLRHGIYKNFSIEIDQHNSATINLTIEDL